MCNELSFKPVNELKEQYISIGKHNFRYNKLLFEEFSKVWVEIMNAVEYGNNWAIKCVSDDFVKDIVYMLEDKNYRVEVEDIEEVFTSSLLKIRW